MTVVPGRSTLYKGVRMRSRLEATWAAHFDEVGITWEYEPLCFASEAGQYLPDFVLERSWQTYVEIKPNLAKSAYWRSRMEIVWASEPDTALLLVGGPPHDHPGWLRLPGHSWVYLERDKELPEEPAFDDSAWVEHAADPTVGAIRRARRP